MADVTEYIAEIARLHDKFAPFACAYDENDECLWCDRTRPVVTWVKVTGTAPTYAKAYAVSCDECGAPVQHRCATHATGTIRTEPHKSRREKGKAQ